MPKTIPLTCLLTTLVACDGARRAQIVDAAPPDAAPDAGLACTLDADCDDGDDCTRDACVADQCVWTRDELAVAPPQVVAIADAQDLQIAGDRLFVARGGEGAEAWDLAADPPARIWSAGPGDVPLDSTRVAAGDSLFVVDAPRDVVALDPASGAVRGRIAAIDPVRDLAARGPLVFAAVGAKGIEVFDFTQPDAPVRIGRGDTRGRASGLALRGDRLLVADGLAGLTVLAVDDPAALRAVGEPVDTAGRAEAVAAWGGFAVLAEALVGYSVFELGSRPARRAAVTARAIADVAMLGPRTALVAGAGGIELVDLIAPAAPVPWATIDAVDVTRMVWQDGRLVALAAGEARVYALSCPTP